jgi:hypothetical protein
MYSRKFFIVFTPNTKSFYEHLSKMRKIKKIGLFSFAKFQSFIGGIIGLVCGVLYSFGGMLIDLLVSFDILSSEAMSSPGLSWGTLLAFGALIGMPILFGVVAFLFGLFGALFYNLFSKWFGGIEIEIED